MIKIKNKIEYAVNSLLKNACPNTYHEFRLFKLVQTYYEYNEDFYKFKDDMKRMYKSRSPLDSSNINKTLNIKISGYDTTAFLVGFHNSTVDPLSVIQAASSLEWIFKNDLNVPIEIANTGTFLSILNSLFKPSPFENFHVTAADFVDYWKKLSFLKFGEKYENLFAYLSSLVEENEFGIVEDVQLQKKIQLTQTQIDWIMRVRKSLETNKLLPKYPLSSQIIIPQLKHIKEHVRAYNYLSSFKHPSAQLKTEKLVKSLNLLCSTVLNESPLQE